MGKKMHEIQVNKNEENLVTYMYKLGIAPMCFSECQFSCTLLCVHR